MSNDKWLTVNEICDYLQVTNETVYTWIDKNEMPAHRVGRRWMFKQLEVDKWVRNGKAAARDYNPKRSRVKTKIKG